MTINAAHVECGEWSVNRTSAGSWVSVFTVKPIRILNVNIRGVYVAIQATVAHIVEGGRAITIGSNNAVRPLTPIGTVYAISKGAVAAMVKGFALDLASRGIRINNIQPGPIETDMTADHVEQIKPVVPLGHIGHPDDIAEPVSYLATDVSRCMTGASPTIDGGMSL